MDKKDIIDYVLTSVSGSDYDMAKLVHMMYENMYCVTNDGGKEKWFKWNGTHWYTSAAIKHELKIKLSEEVGKVVSIARHKLRQALMDAGNDERIFVEHRMKNLVGLEQRLQDTSVKDRILKECESHFFVENLPARR